MNKPERLDIELPPDLAEAVRARVASGDYASASEMVREGLELLADRERAIDPAIGAELASGFDSWKAAPADVRSIADVREQFRERRPRG